MRDGVALNGSFKCFKCSPVCFSSEDCGSLKLIALAVSSGKNVSLSGNNNPKQQKPGQR